MEQNCCVCDKPAELWDREYDEGWCAEHAARYEVVADGVTVILISE